MKTNVTVMGEGWAIVGMVVEEASEVGTHEWGLNEIQKLCENLQGEQCRPQNQQTKVLEARASQ